MAQPALASELLLKARDGHIIEAWINNQIVRLRVDPESPGYLVLNPDAAWRLRLYPTLVPATAIVGPIRVPGASRVARLFLGGVTTTRRVVWTERKVVEDADGIISPADLPYERVTLQFRAPEASETQTELSMRFHPALGLYRPVSLQGSVVHFRISTSRADTLATAAAGAMLAEGYGGAWLSQPRDMMIKYGVFRPVRSLALARPFVIADQPLPGLLVRTNNRDEATGPKSDPDPDEIIVTAIRARRPAYMVSLGRDWMRWCSNITWNNRTRQMTLSCSDAASGAPPAAALLASQDGHRAS
jgi:hypothetical protein